MTTELIDVKPCHIDGCDKPRKRGRTLCSMHVARKWRHGDSNTVLKPRRDARGICIIDGCDEPDKGPHGYCDKHRTRIRRHGDPTVTLKEYQRLANGHIAYETAHWRVKRAHGPAWQHLCCLCMAYAEDWAYDHNDPAEIISPEGRAYSTEPAHYIPLCRSCHRKFDAPYGTRRDDCGRYAPADDTRPERTQP